MFDREDDVLGWMESFWVSIREGDDPYSQGGLGLRCNGGIIEFWRAQYRALCSETKFTANSLTPPISVVPAPPGCGKSVLLRVFCAFHGWQTRLLIGNRQKSECDDFVRDTRVLVGRLRDEGLINDVPVIAAWHSSNRDDRSLSADVLAVTHQTMQLAALQEWRFELLHRGRPGVAHSTPKIFPDDDGVGDSRRWVIDEAMSLTQSVSLPVGELRRAAEFLRVQLVGNPAVAALVPPAERTAIVSEIERLEALCEWAEAIPPSGSDAIRSEAVEVPNLVRLLDRDDLADRLVTIGASAAAARKALQETVQIAVAVAGRGLFASKYRGKTTLYAATPVLADGAASLVILDATAEMLPSWRFLRSEGVPVRVCRPPETAPEPRRYEQLRIIPFFTPRDAGSGLLAQYEGGDHEFVSQALAELERQCSLRGINAGAPVILTHKALALMIRDTMIDARVAWFGKHDKGSNLFSDVSSMLILGAYRTPMGVSQAEAGALAELLPARPGEGAALKLAQEDHEAVLVCSVIQAINRTRCRRVVDAAGHCDPTTVLIAVRRETWGILEPALRRAMPGVDLGDPVLSAKVKEGSQGRITKEALLGRVKDELEKHDTRTDGHRITLTKLLERAIGSGGNQHRRKLVVESFQEPQSVLFPVVRDRGLSLEGTSKGKTPMIVFRDGSVYLSDSELPLVLANRPHVPSSRAGELLAQGRGRSDNGQPQRTAVGQAS